VRDAQGNLLYYEGTVEDITERKHSEEQIRLTTAELSRSREELRVKNQLREENLRTAREIQNAMLPQQYPTFPKNSPSEQSAFWFTHRYQPAEAVSGDFFSIIQISDSEVGVFICDVTGHGVRAALVTAMIRALSEELKPLAREPGLFLRKLNSDLSNILKSTGSTMLTTAFYLIANCQTGTMRFANAGHPKPLVLRRAEKRVEMLANAGGHGQPALGLFEEPPYETSETMLAPGDFVMLFTDGLFEVQGRTRNCIRSSGSNLTCKTCLKNPPRNCSTNCWKTIRAFSVDHEFEDDVSLVGMEFAGVPAAKS
jgi:sigma-B regulation protein RsbU (phosphoserine phosphatase)